jgi:hypothetical protein
MAQQTDISVPAQTWTQVTDADVTSITFQVRANDAVYIKGTTGAVAPTDTTGAIVYWSGQGELNKSLSDMFPGIAAVRVYAYCDGVATVSVGHG